MKDPGPNNLEQLIQANTTLAAILAATGAPAPSSPGIFSLYPILHPALFYDNAEGTFQWTVTGTAGEYKASYETSGALVGLKGLVMHTKTDTPAGGDYVKANIYVPGGAGPIVRFQLSFRRDAATSTHFTTQIRFHVNNEANILNAFLEAHWQIARLAYLMKTNGGWAMTEMDDSHLRPGEGQWHTLNVAINIETAKWISIVLNGKSLTIANDALEEGVSTYHDRGIRFELGTLAIPNEMAGSHFDQLLITTEEAP